MQGFAFKKTDSLACTYVNELAKDLVYNLLHIAAVVTALYYNNSHCLNSKLNAY